MKLVGLIALATLFASAANAATKDIELLRPTDMGSSAAALAVVKKALAARDFNLKDVPFSGDATVGDATSAPAAALVSGHEVRVLAEQRKLGDITLNAQNDHWANVIINQVRPYAMSHDRWVAAPLDVMPLNGLWINAALMQRIGGTAPDTIEGLFSLLERARSAGLKPLVVGGAPRDLAVLFEQVVIATAGADVYKRVFVDNNEMSIQSDEMIRAFETFARLRPYIFVGEDSRATEVAAQLVVKGEALAFAGAGSTDLLFTASGKIADKDYLCQRFPGTGSIILYQMDIIAMLKVNAEDWAAQSALADVVMNPQVQTDASLARGAIPVRADADTSTFGACATRDVNDLQLATAAGNFLGSTAYGFTQGAAATAAYVDVVTRFFRGEIPTAEAATAALREALASAP